MPRWRHGPPARRQTMEEFLSVSGVGEVKARKYGAAFLAVLARAEKEEV